MSHTAEPETPRAFHVTAAISEGLRVLRAEAAPMTLIVVLFYFAPGALVQTLESRTLGWVAHPGMAWAGVLAAFFVVGAICPGATAKVVIDRLDGRPSSIAAALGAGLRVLPLALAAALITEAPELPLFWSPAGIGPQAAVRAIGAAFVVNLIVSAFLGLVVPAAVDEAGGPAAAVVRAWRLACGARWRLGALALIYLVAFVAAQLVAADMSQGWSGEAQAYAVQAAGALVTLVDASVTPAAYVQLRRLRDSARPATIARVFD